MCWQFPHAQKKLSGGGFGFAELFTQSRSLPLYGAPTFHWHLTFVFKVSKVTIASKEQLQTERRESVCVRCLLYAKTGIFAECIPLRVPVARPPISKDKRSFPHDF